MSDPKLLSAESIEQILSSCHDEGMTIVADQLEQHIATQAKILVAALKEVEGMEHEQMCGLGGRCTICRRYKGAAAHSGIGAPDYHTFAPPSCNCARGRLVALLKG